MGKAMGNFTELDAYLFGQGTHYDIYKKLGAHLSVDGKKKGVRFAVWAPSAKRVFVIGEFNGWDETANEMEREDKEFAEDENLEQNAHQELSLIHI